MCQPDNEIRLVRANKDMRDSTDFEILLAQTEEKNLYNSTKSGLLLEHQCVKRYPTSQRKYSSQDRACASQHEHV